MGYENRICKCGTEFEPWQYNQKQCGSCVEKYNKKKGRPVNGRDKKTCPNCEVEFLPRTPRHTYCTAECRDGHRWAYYMKTYGIDKKGFDDLMKSAHNKCQICHSDGFLMKSTHNAKLVVDHCHKSGEIRGVLCHNCNRALGLMNDSAESLNRAIQYLEGATTIENTSDDESEGSE